MVQPVFLVLVIILLISLIALHNSRKQCNELYKQNRSAEAELAKCNKRMVIRSSVMAQSKVLRISAAIFMPSRIIKSLSFSVSAGHLRS